MGLRPTVGADGARSLSDDIVDLHLLPVRLPGQAGQVPAHTEVILRGSRSSSLITSVEPATPQRRA